jgi:hypothetical protein
MKVTEAADFRAGALVARANEIARHAAILAFSVLASSALSHARGRT